MTKFDQHLGATEHDKHGFVAFEALPGMPTKEEREEICTERIYLPAVPSD